MNPRAEADVLVVGGGPAGSATALLLARAGWEVRLIERSRFPRPKACGETVNPGAVRLLAAYGLLERVMAVGPSRIRGWWVSPGDGPAARGLFAHRSASSPPPLGREVALGLPRARLDAALLEAAACAGVKIETELRAETLEETPGCDGIQLRARARDIPGHRLYRGRFLVGADGLRSTVAKLIGAARPPAGSRKLSLSGRVRGTGPDRSLGALRVEGHRTVGLAPVDSGGPLWNVTVVVDSRAQGHAVREDPGQFLLDQLSTAGFAWATGPELLGRPLASGPFDRPVRLATRGRVLLAGDAAGYYDPLTGQGIYRALRSAGLAFASLDRALRHGVGGWEPELAEYGRALSAEFAPGRRVQRAIEAVLTRGPARRGAFRLLSRAPRGLGPLVAVTGDLERPATLADPRSWLSNEPLPPAPLFPPAAH